MDTDDPAHGTISESNIKFDISNNLISAISVIGGDFESELPTSCKESSGLVRDDLKLEFIWPCTNEDIEMFLIRTIN